MTTSERACDDLDVLMNELCDEYVDGEQLRAAVKALQLARDLVERIERTGDADTRRVDDLRQRVRDIPDWLRVREWR